MLLMCALMFRSRISHSSTRRRWNLTGTPYTFMQFLSGKDDERMYSLKKMFGLEIWRRLLSLVAGFAIADNIILETAWNKEDKIE